MKPAVRLHVITGRHAGATQVLDQKPFILGSSLEADIVLTDASVLGRHAQLTPRGSAIELGAIEGEIVFDGQTIRPGSKWQTRYPLRFALGEAELEVTAVSAQAKQPIASVMTIGGFSLLCLLVAAKVYFDLSGQSTDLAAKSGQASAMNAAPKPAAAQADLAKFAAEALGERLRSLNIDSISVTPGTGTVSASGTIDPQRKDVWQSSQVWFDENFGQHLVLQSEVSAVLSKPVKAPIAIQSVWRGKFPYLIDGEGNKYFEGSMLKGGWLLEKIQEDKILISKDKVPLLLKF